MVEKPGGSTVLWIVGIGLGALLSAIISIYIEDPSAFSMRGVFQWWIGSFSEQAIHTGVFVGSTILLVGLLILGGAELWHMLQKRRARFRAAIDLAKRKHLGKQIKAEEAERRRTELAVVKMEQIEQLIQRDFDHVVQSGEILSKPRLIHIRHQIDALATELDNMGLAPVDKSGYLDWQEHVNKLLPHIRRHGIGEGRLRSGLYNNSDAQNNNGTDDNSKRAEHFRTDKNVS